MNEKKHFDDGSVAARTPNGDLVIGFPGQHLDDAGVSRFNAGETADVWEARAEAEGAKTKLDDDGFFPM